MKLFSLLLISVLIIGCTSPAVEEPAQQLAQQESFLTFENALYGVKIGYPADWQLDDRDDTIAAFLSPKIDASDNFQENLGLSMNDLAGEGLTLSTFTEKAVAQLKNTFPDIQIIESKETMLAALPAHRIVFTASGLKFMQTWTMTNDIAYIWTYAATEASYEEYLGTVQKMLNSFEITRNIREDNEEASDIDGFAAKEISPPMTGVYRCWSYNVGGAGKSCTSPPLRLNADGSYSMSSEQGTYTVQGDTIILSASKIRGPGTILEGGNQIRFEYDYNGWHHTVTYAKTDWE